MAIRMLPRRRPNALLTDIQVAEQLSLKRRTLQAWRYRGYGPPAIALSGRAVRYRQEDVDAWITSR